MFGSLKAALADIRANHDKFVSKREKLLQRREDLRSMPICKEDFLSIINDEIDNHAVDYRTRMQQTVDSFIGKGSSFENAHHITNIPLLAPWSGSPKDKVTLSAMFALFGNEMKTALSKVIADLDWPKAGPPIAERKKELAKLDEEISKVDVELEGLKTIALQNGIQLTTE